MFVFCARCGSPNRDTASFCVACGVGLEELAVGVELQGRYRVEARLGRGGMGAVYRVLDQRLDCACALKELAVMPAQSPEEQRVALERFEQEARMLRRLSHPGLPRVQDFFSENDRYYLVQDFVDGETLESALIERGEPGLPEGEVTEVAVGVLEVLYYLHTQVPPILHRDIKPANVMRSSDDGRVVLVDFGIARRINRNTGTSIGTEGYAPPEQYRGRAEARSDLYALGATMHHLLSGRAPDVPFHFDPIARLVEGVSPRMQRVLEGVLDRDVTQRFANAVVMRDALVLGARASSRGVRKVTVPLEAQGPTVVRPAARSSMPPPSAPFVTASRSHTIGSPLGTSARKPLGDEHEAHRISLGSPQTRPLDGLIRRGNNAQGFEEALNAKDATILIRIPGGHFQMGSKEQADERPPHEVDVPSFWMAKMPVSVAQFRRFVEATGHVPAGDWLSCGRSWGEHAPVAKVSWHDAAAYCDWACLQLPTETVWEYAARGTDGRRFPWGNTWDPTRCRHDLASVSRGTVSVGSYLNGASPFGCLDMAGNVWEWTSSWYKRYPGNLSSGNYYGQTYRVLRGGSWFLSDPALFRCSNRLHAHPDHWSGTWGFRCARTI